MPVDTQKVKALLEKRRSELQNEIAQVENEGREGMGAEVGDEMDYVTGTEARAGAFMTATILSDTLKQVEDALARLADGTYGRCIDCGRPIEQVRLDAVPWTPYCREDQEKHDSQKAAPDPLRDAPDMQS